MRQSRFPTEISNQSLQPVTHFSREPAATVKHRDEIRAVLRG